MKIYAFRYNFNIHESAPNILSLHQSEKGAIDAMEKHKQYAKKKWNAHDKWQRERYGEKFKGSKFGEYEEWFVDKVEVLP